MGEPDAESGPYNLCKYKHFAPHAHAILRFFRAHKPTMALLSPAEPLSHSALCFYRGKFPGDSFRCPPSCFRWGTTFRLLPQIVCWLRMTARLLRLISLPLRAKVFCLRIAGEKRGILAEKWGRKQEKFPFFRCLIPCFSNHDAPPCSLSRCLFAPRLRPTEAMSWPNFAARCVSSSYRDGLRWTRDERASFAGTSTGCGGEGIQKRPRSTKIDRGRELECAGIAARTAARRLSVCLCVCRKIR